MRVFSYRINDREVAFEFDDETARGEDRVLLEEDDDLTRNLPWHDIGYTVVPFLAAADCRRIRDGIRDLVAQAVQQHGVQTGEHFELRHYHRVVPDDDRHLEIVRQTGKGFDLDKFPIDVQRVCDRISDICGVRVGMYNPAFPVTRFYIRIIRPRPNRDNNPPHRDVWLDRLRHGINIYAPIAGSNADSSLAVAPGSHLWKESEVERTCGGARIGGSSYTVPAVTGTSRPLEMVRPDPQEDEVLVFSPYLIHGGAMNLCGDETRVSLEMRFWRIEQNR